MAVMRRVGMPPWPLCGLRRLCDAPYSATWLTVVDDVLIVFFKEL